MTERDASTKIFQECYGYTWDYVFNSTDGGVRLPIAVNTFDYLISLRNVTRSLVLDEMNEELE